MTTNVINYKIVYSKTTSLSGSNCSYLTLMNTTGHFRLFSMWLTRGLPSTHKFAPKPTWKTWKHSVPTSHTTPKLEWNNLDWHTTNKFPRAHGSWNTHTCRTGYDLWIWPRKMMPINNPSQWHYEFLYNTPFRVPNSWVLSYKATIHIQRLNKTDNDKVHWEPFGHSLNSSSHCDHQLLNKNNMNKLCLLRRKAQQKCLRLR